MVHVKPGARGPRKINSRYVDGKSNVKWFVPSSFSGLAGDHLTSKWGNHMLLNLAL